MADPSNPTQATASLANVTKSSETELKSKSGPQQAAQTGIDEEEAALYDRQLRLWGVEAQNRMRNASVLVVKFRGIAAEACKNIVLAGTGSVTILDDEDLDESDLGANFFARVEEVGQKRVHAVKARLNALNPRVQVIAETDMSKLQDDEFLASFTLICLTDSDAVTIAQVNDRCRRVKKPFYTASSIGLHGYIFADLLDHDFLVERQIIVAGSTEAKKVQKKMSQSFTDFKNAVVAPWKLSPKKLKKVSKMTWVILALFEYQKQHGGQLPSSVADAPTVFSLAGPLFSSFGVDPSLLSMELLETACTVGSMEFIGSCALVGAILSQDILNALGGKEAPIVNFCVWDGKTCSADVYPLGVDRT